MPSKFKVEVEFLLFERQSITPLTVRVGKFKAKITGIYLTGYINATWKSMSHKGSYVIRTDNKQLTKHPEYKAIRGQLLEKYRKFIFTNQNGCNITDAQ